MSLPQRTLHDYFTHGRQQTSFLRFLVYWHFNSLKLQLFDLNFNIKIAEMYIAKEFADDDVFADEGKSKI